MELMVMEMREETKEVAPQMVLVIVLSTTKTYKPPLLAWRQSSKPSQNQQAAVVQTEAQAAMEQMVAEMVEITIMGDQMATSTFITQVRLLHNKEETLDIMTTLMTFKIPGTPN
jgi:predicted secreted acid phosphatase